ncbi:MAG TPA: PQQ-dependent sugar dehydrogenase [Gemmatimonadales bacterium]|nr:PQQ-dependent sugar dehydrogenase [Gemmatimonadales bacterium]
MSRASRCLAILLALPLFATALAAPRPAPLCAPDNAGLKLAGGFCASVVATDVRGVRHLAVGPDGALYAATRGGFLGGGVTAFLDRNGDGKMDERVSFGPKGGNDVAVHDGYLYLTFEDRVIRWRLTPGQLKPQGEPETIVAGLQHQGHGDKTLAFPGGNVMLVKIGSATNSCQAADRAAKSPGIDPCTELERHAGIWRFDAAKPGQQFSDGLRFATGMRNAEALTVQPGTNQVWAAIHGRDQLGDNWGFSPQANANNPAEELVQVDEGDDFGWPYCYFSNDTHQLVLAPEYGGDGRKVGRCSSAKGPAIAFPGHWAPMALAFYPGDGFGPLYKGGLFLTFHGSWNRAPLPQDGFRVAFAPFADDKPTGSYRTFAMLPDNGMRPVGVAVGKDGALFISADNSATIWRVVRSTPPGAEMHSE